MKVKVAQSCLTFCDLIEYTVHGILQARILEWVAIPFSRGVFPTQGSNSGLLHWRQILYQLSHKGSPRILPEFAQIHVHQVSDVIQSSHPLPPASSLAFSLSQHFSNELALRIRWPKYWSFSFHISPSNEYSWLISFRMDWLDLLAVQGTLKSLFQHDN